MSVGEARVTTQTHRGHVRMEAEMRVTCPQTKERQGPRQPPEAGQARQVSSLESEGTQPCPHPDFGPLASRAGRERPAVLSKAPSLCVGRAQLQDTHMVGYILIPSRPMRKWRHREVDGRA